MYFSSATATPSNFHFPATSKFTPGIPTLGTSFFQSMMRVVLLLIISLCRFVLVKIDFFLIKLWMCTPAGSCRIDTSSWKHSQKPQRRGGDACRCVSCCSAGGNMVSQRLCRCNLECEICTIVLIPKISSPRLRYCTQDVTFVCSILGSI